MRLQGLLSTLLLSLVLAQGDDGETDVVATPTSVQPEVAAQLSKPKSSKGTPKSKAGKETLIDVNNFEKDVHNHDQVWVVLFTNPDGQECKACTVRA